MHSSKKIPDCLRGQGDHIYEDGICKACGEHELTETGITRLKVIICRECGTFMSINAVRCPNPECLCVPKPTLFTYINRFYLFVIEPIRIFLLCPRPSGMSFMEQFILIVCTTIGVGMSSYIRAAPSEVAEPIRAREIFAAVVIAVIVIPSLFKEPQFLDSNTPFVYRISLAVQKGVFSDVIVQGFFEGLLEQE